jgi:thiol-disulfide isomerase/thioredoxin
MKSFTLLLFGAWCCICISAPLSQHTLPTHGAATTAVIPLLRGDKAPNFSLMSLIEKRDISLEDYKGKVVYVDFWASWCMPCRRSFPFLNRLRKQFGDGGFEIIAVNLDQDPQAAMLFLDKFPVDYPVVKGFDSNVSRDYNISAMPTAYMIGKDGKIRGKHLGFKASQQDYLEAVVDKLVSEF